MPIVKEVVAEDAMSKRTVVRLSLPVTVEELNEFMPQQVPTPETWLSDLKNGICSWMKGRNLPNPSIVVLSNCDASGAKGRFWCEAPKDEAEHQRITELTGCNLSISRGVAFIEASFEPLSHEAAYARIHFMAEQCECALQDEDWQSSFHFAVAIGEMLKEQTMRFSFLDVIEKANSELAKRRVAAPKGGDAQRNKKEQRYRVLCQLARENISKFTLASDRQALRVARQLAQEYDEQNEPRLFSYTNGNLLSNNWFNEWLSAFRRQALLDIERKGKSK